MTVTDAAPIVKRQNNDTVDNTSVDIIGFIIMLLMWQYCVRSKKRKIKKLLAAYDAARRFSTHSSSLFRTVRCDGDSPSGVD
jgi:hypothetical protein